MTDDRDTQEQYLNSCLEYLIYDEGNWSHFETLFETEAEPELVEKWNKYKVEECNNEYNYDCERCLVYISNNEEDFDCVCCHIFFAFYQYRKACGTIGLGQ